MQNLIFINPDSENNLNITLDKTNQKIETFIFFIARKKDFYSLNTHISHLTQNTYSKTIVRGVLFDQASAQIKGNLIAMNNCKGSKAILDQHILLIGENSKAKTMPFMEIGEKNLIASHKSKISFLDKNFLSFLSSRGFTQKASQVILIKSFFHNLLAKIENDNDKNKLINFIDKYYAKH